MALDGLYLRSLIQEIKDIIINCKVEKVNQPEKDEIVLSFKKNRKSYKLLISSSSNYPRIHFTENNKENPNNAPLFCMVLRKYLNSATVLDVRQVESDRLLIIDFESSDELGFDSVYSLIIEIMGRHSNISLVRQRDNIVLDCIKHITPDINSFRVLYTGVEYVYPPSSTKLNSFNFTYEEFVNYIKNNEVSFDTKFFTKVFTGISASLSSELVYRLDKENILFTVDNLENIYKYIHEIIKILLNNEFFLATYLKNNNLKEFHCIKFTCLEDCTIEQYNTPSELIEGFYFKKDKIDRLNAKSADLQKIINNNLDRCNKKMRILNDTLKECEDKDKLKLYGELLTANIYTAKKGDKYLEVLNYYSENEEYIKIPLNENKTPSENIQVYFKKYNKLKKSEEMAIIQLEHNEDELKYLQSVLTNILNADSYTEIEEIRPELIESGYIAFKKSKNTKKVKTSKPMHFVSSDGLDIYVGKNNLQNDFLTLKFADKNDIWMHTKNIPGSHVIIKNPGIVPETTLLEAATLAAYYSKSQNSSNVPVDYIEAKHVKKPSGAKPGMVIYHTNKTIYVTPDELKLQKLNN